MQLNIGIKIRELRHRDGRTQEALADALGVTSQAVSRWESGGSYPDMEMVPAIANYFHVSIDELFGYHNDREEKIRQIVAEAEQAMVAQGRTMHKGCLPDDFDQLLDRLRVAAKEFPNEPRILMELAHALHHRGWSHYGCQLIRNEDTGTYEEDTTGNAQNEYWQEAIDIFEKLLKCELHPQQRSLVIFQLVGLYGRMGEHEKAKELAASQNDVRICKELMLYYATDGQEKARYRAEGLLELLFRARGLVWDFVVRNPDVSISEYGRPLILAFLQVYEQIFSDGRCGVYHFQMGQEYQGLARLEISREGELQNILTFFDKAFDHFKAYKSLCDEGEYTYTAPFVSAMKPVTKKDVIQLDEKIWENELRRWPENILSELRKNPKYAECFAWESGEA